MSAFSLRTLDFHCLLLSKAFVKPLHNCTVVCTYNILNQLIIQLFAKNKKPLMLSRELISPPQSASVYPTKRDEVPKGNWEASDNINSILMKVAKGTKLPLDELSVYELKHGPQPLSLLE